MGTASLEAPGPAEGAASRNAVDLADVLPPYRPESYCGLDRLQVQCLHSAQRTENIPMSRSGYDAVQFSLWFIVSLDFITNDMWL